MAPTVSFNDLLQRYQLVVSNEHTKDNLIKVCARTLLLFYLTSTKLHCVEAPETWCKIISRYLVLGKCAFDALSSSSCQHHVTPVIPTCLEFNTKHSDLHC